MRRWGERYFYFSNQIMSWEIFTTGNYPGVTFSEVHPYLNTAKIWISSSKSSNVILGKDWGVVLFCFVLCFGINRLQTVSLCGKYFQLNVTFCLNTLHNSGPEELSTWYPKNYIPSLSIFSPKLSCIPLNTMGMISQAKLTLHTW